MDDQQNENIGNLQDQMASFESTKSEIVSSGLGQAIGLTASSIWSQIVEKIKAVVNRGAINQTLNAGGSYTIPQGYHNGSGKVTANSLASQTDANAGAAQILSGFTAWIKGNKVTGSMPNRGALNWSGSNTTYGVPAGYYSGGTIDSRPSYTNGYNAGVSAADNRVNTNSQSYKSGYNAGVAAKTSQYKTGDWTLTRAGFLNLGFQPNVFMLIVGDDLHGTPMGMYCNLGGLVINHMEAPSNTHLSDIFYVNGNGIGLNDRALSYANNKYTKYIAARIV